jgi:hypothetical protein
MVDEGTRNILFPSFHAIKTFGVYKPMKRYNDEYRTGEGLVGGSYDKAKCKYQGLGLLLPRARKI